MTIHLSLTLSEHYFLSAMQVLQPILIIISKIIKIFLVIIFFLLSQDIVLKSAKSMKATMTSGPDNVPSFFIKDCASVLDYPLTIIFNMALKTGVFPSDWKSAKICPVYKAGDKTIVNNYRPIANIQNFAKVFEKAISETLQIALKKIIVDEQHGCLKGKSTLTNLVIFTQIINEALQKCLQVDVAFLDFSKAFDLIDHSILANKLVDFDIPINLRILLLNYLYQRSHKVSIGGVSSGVFVPNKGVPQGSSLGYSFFSIYINDIVNDIK